MHFHFVYFPFTLLLPGKTLAVLESPCNDVALRSLLYCFGILEKTRYKKRANKKGSTFDAKMFLVFIMRRRMGYSCLVI